MTTTEITNLLETAAIGLETGHALFPADLVAKLTTTIKTLDESTLAQLATLIGYQSKEPGKDIANIIKILNGVTELFTTNQWSQIAQFCRKIEQRKLLIKIISNHLGSH